MAGPLCRVRRFVIRASPDGSAAAAGGVTCRATAALASQLRAQLQAVDGGVVDLERRHSASRLTLLQVGPPAPPRFFIYVPQH